MLEQVRKANPILLIASMIVVFAMWTLSHYMGADIINIFYFIQESTAGLIWAKLVIYLIMFSVVALLFLVIGKLRLRDVGFVPARIPVGLASMLGLWVLFQITVLIVNLLFGEPLRIHPTWNSAEAIAAMFGVLIFYTFGVALYEEIVFRGFLVGQLYHYCPSIFIKSGVRTAYAIVLSSLLFGLGHLPQRLTQGFGLAELPAHALIIAAGGIYLCVIWIITNNLFIAIAMHSLLDALIDAKNPPLLFATEHLQVVLAIVSTGILVWAVIHRIVRQRRER